MGNKWYVIDVTFSVWIVIHGAVGARVWELWVFVMQMLHVCLPLVTVLNAAFCMTNSVLMLVEDARGDYMEDVYYRAGFTTALYVAMSVLFSLPHGVAAIAYIICRGLCASIEMSVCVLYVSFGSKTRPRTCGCIAMGSVVLFILSSRLLLYSVGSGVNRVQTVCLYLVWDCYVLSRQNFYVSISWLYSCLSVCRCDGDVIGEKQELSRCICC